MLVFWGGIVFTITNPNTQCMAYLPTFTPKNYPKCRWISHTLIEHLGNEALIHVGFFTTYPTTLHPQWDPSVIIVTSGSPSELSERTFGSGGGLIGKAMAWDGQVAEPMVVMQLELKVSLHPGNWHIEFQRWRFGRWFSISMRGDLCRFHVSFEGKPKEPYQQKTGVHTPGCIGVILPWSLKTSQNPSF